MGFILSKGVRSRREHPSSTDVFEVRRVRLVPGEKGYDEEVSFLWIRSLMVVYRSK